MDLNNPRTYNELMIYVRCKKIRELVPSMTPEQYTRIQEFMLASSEHIIRIRDGMLGLYKRDELLESFSVPPSDQYSFLILTQYVLLISRPTMDSSYGSSYDSGSSGNNNNNNNNNNA